jgi:hypothetical protein
MGDTSRAGRRPGDVIDGEVVDREPAGDRGAQRPGFDDRGKGPRWPDRCRRRYRRALSSPPASLASSSSQTTASWLASRLAWGQAAAGERADDRPDAALFSRVPDRPSRPGSPSDGAPAAWKATSAASGARARFQLPLIHRADMVQMPSSARHGDPNAWRSGARSERHSALIGQPNRANMSSIIGKLVHYMLQEAEDDL